MKKLVFAAQVFGLLAMIPIVVFLEMNHTTGSLPEYSNATNVTTISEKPFMKYTKKSTDKMPDEIFVITMILSF